MKTPPCLVIQLREPPGTGIRRIAREQMDAVRAVLQKGGDPVEAVHEARKSLKKLRAAVRLVAPQFPPRRRKTEKALLRKAARLLGPLRDAEVRLETAAKLIQDAPANQRKFAAIQAALTADRDHIATGAAAAKWRVRALLNTSREHLQTWPVKSLTMNDLLAVVRRSYRNGRRALDAYESRPSPEAFHEWRKRVKELWYQLRILRCAFRKAEVERRIKRLNKLGKIAGAAHDLDALRTSLSQLARPGVQTASMVREIDTHAPELYSAALKKGRKFYKKKPAEFMRCIMKL